MERRGKSEKNYKGVHQMERKPVGQFGVLAVCLVLSVSSVVGCGRGERRVFRGKETGKKTSRISKEDLRQALDKFEEFAAAENKEQADELDRLVPTLRARRANLSRRTRLRQVLRTMLDHDDPITAFIEAWALCVRVRYYLVDGRGADLYGEYQSLAIEGWKRIEERIEQVGREFLDDDTFGETRNAVHQFARANPIGATWSSFVVYATEVEPGKPGAFDEIVSIPMSPFTALKGVDRTASSIYAVRGSMERFADILEELPEAIQWQVLLLLMQMGETEVVETFLTNMSKISDSTAQFADTAEKWPQTIREQASILVEEIDTKQANLQVTLEKAEKTAVALDQTVKSINEVVQGVESAANATGDVIKEFKSIPRPEKKDDAPKTDIKDYRDTVQEVTNAAIEIKALTAEVRELIESKALPAHITEVNSRVVGVVDRTAVQARSLTDRIFWRLAQLSALIFVLVLLYRFVVVRFAGPRQR
jgi:hypothetical protein